MRVLSIFFGLLVAFGSHSYAESPISLLSSFTESLGGNPEASTAKTPPNVVRLPFSSNKQITRSYKDYSLKQDLSNADRFILTLNPKDAKAIGSVSLYFRSGKGWRSFGGGSLRNDGRTTIEFFSADVQFEGTPESPAKTDLCRAAFWRGNSVDSEVELIKLEAETSSVLTIFGEDAPSETDVAATGKRFWQMLRDIGVRSGQIPQSQLTENSLLNRKVVVLPYNPRISDEQVALLKKYVENGGKIIAFYQLPLPLLQQLGFDRVSYFRPEENSGTLASVRFSQPSREKYGLPESFAQNSWNINFTKPNPNRTDAHVAAYWHDKDGKQTAYPAFVMSDSGAFFSHILSNDDIANKKAFLVALMGHFDSSYWETAAKQKLRDIEEIGLPLSLRKESQNAWDWRATDKWNEFISNKDRIDENLKNLKTPKEWHAAYNDLSALHSKMSSEYIRCVGSEPNERRFWWEHAGTGAYPGDWDKTMKELKENGFTAVLPNMLWGGIAHYESDLLPRSSTFEKYGDQIQQAVAAGKKYGIEVHVWKVNYNAQRAPKEFLEKMRKEGRLQRKADGSEHPWLCPSNPENRKLECDSMIEVAKKYDVNGIHFDYIRYPSDDVCFCDGCKERFAKEIGKSDFKWPSDCLNGPLREAYNDWRCEQITKLVADVHRESKKIKPNVEISAAVFSRYPACRQWVLQDWPIWVEKGYLDFLCPMNYTTSPFEFQSLIESQQEQTGRKIPIYPGIGATSTGITASADSVAAQIEISRQLNTKGFTIFNLNANSMSKIAVPLKNGPTK